MVGVFSKVLAGWQGVRVCVRVCARAHMRAAGVSCVRARSPVMHGAAAALREHCVVCGRASQSIEEWGWTQHRWTL